MTPEGRIKAKVKRRLAAVDNKAWVFMPVQKGMGIPALDFLLCVKGHFVAIETKADKSKKLSPQQLSTVLRMLTAGGLVFVVYDDATLDDCIAHLAILEKFA
jgi:hypothetical protein